MIEVEHLHKVYGSTVALGDVSFRVEPGEIVGFLGPNGAGKTTTIRILTGYLPATSGTARVAERDVHSDSMAVRQRIGYLPERPPLYLDMTVEGFLQFVARLKGVPAGDRTRRVNHAVERCGLADRRSLLIRKLSKGYRQRVGIAQAIVHDPPVIVLDEPTSGLDPRQNNEVRQLIRSLAGDHTILLSTHILPEVDATCNRVVIINRGQVVAEGDLSTLMTQLTGSVSYDVEVRGAPADIQQAIAAVPGVAAVTPQPTTGQTESRCRFSVTSHANTDPGEAIAATLVNGGFGLCELRRHQASLEEVFLNLTTEEPQGDSPHQDVDTPMTPSTEVAPENAEAMDMPAEPSAIHEA